MQTGGRVALMSLPSGDVKWLKVDAGDTVHMPAVAQMRRLERRRHAGADRRGAATSRPRILYTMTADSGALKMVDTLHDTAWVDGPCFGGASDGIDGGKAHLLRLRGRRVGAALHHRRPTAATGSS